MVKRSRLVNTGNETETNPEAEVDASFSPGDNPAGNEPEGDAGESEQDAADREAAGIPDKPSTRSATNASAS